MHVSTRRDRRRLEAAAYPYATLFVPYPHATPFDVSGGYAGATTYADTVENADTDRFRT